VLTFAHQDKNCIDINGKSYFLVRGHKSYRSSEFVFVQVTGSTPLRKEDMPSKDWEVFVSRVGKDRIWTAYKRPLFLYTTERQDPHLMFVGASELGSYYLALRYLARRYGIEAKNDLIVRQAHRLMENTDNRLRRCMDEGNVGVPAISVDFSEWHWGWKEEERKSLAEGLLNVGGISDVHGDTAESVA